MPVLLVVDAAGCRGTWIDHSLPVCPISSVKFGQNVPLPHNLWVLLSSSIHSYRASDLISGDVVCAA